MQANDQCHAFAFITRSVVGCGPIRGAVVITPYALRLQKFKAAVFQIQITSYTDRQRPNVRHLDLRSWKSSKTLIKLNFCDQQPASQWIQFFPSTVQNGEDGKGLVSLWRRDLYQMENNILLQIYCLTRCSSFLIWFLSAFPPCASRSSNLSSSSLTWRSADWRPLSELPRRSWHWLSSCCTRAA